MNEAKGAIELLTNYLTVKGNGENEIVIEKSVSSPM